MEPHGLSAGGRHLGRHLCSVLLLAGVLLTLCLLLPATASALMSTGDGGWRGRTRCPRATTLQAVSALDAQHAVAAGDSGTILTTSDGGASWAAHDIGIARAHVADLSFADANDGWAQVWVQVPNLGGIRHFVEHTTDGGLTWAAKPFSCFRPPLISSTQARLGLRRRYTSARPLTAASPGARTTCLDWGAQRRRLYRRQPRLGRGRLPGRPSTTPISTRSSWRPVTAGPAGTGSTSPSQTGRRTQLGQFRRCGPWLGRGQRISDMGGAGSSLRPPTGEPPGARRAPATAWYLSGASFVDAEHGWLPGAAASTPPPTAAPPGRPRPSASRSSAVSFADDLHGYAVGRQWRHRDHHRRRRQLAGAQLDDSGCAASRAFRTSAFPDATHGWAVGDHVILATTDGGATWNGSDGERRSRRA